VNGDMKWQGSACSVVRSICRVRASPLCARGCTHAPPAQGLRFAIAQGKRERATRSRTRDIAISRPHVSNLKGPSGCHGVLTVPMGRRVLRVVSRVLIYETAACVWRRARRGV
jgi:hypothetical protein